MVGRRYDVFISYSRENQQAAEALEESLRKDRRLKVWRDTSRLQIGQTFPIEIIDAIWDSAGVIVLWSAASVRSAWVRDEAFLAYSLNRMFPAFLERGIEMQLEPQYQQMNAAHLFAGQTEAQRKIAIDALVSAVRNAKK